MKTLITSFGSLGLIIATLTGCSSVNKYNSFIKEKTGTSVTESPVHSNDYITIKSDALKGTDSVIRSKKTKGLFIPAVLYWQWNHTIENDLGYIIPLNIIRPTIFNYAESMKLKDKLNGQQLEISIEKVPSSFKYDKSGRVIIFIFAYSTQEQEAIYPSGDELVASYRILKDGNETKKGILKLSNIDQPKANREHKSTKKLTWAYIDDYYGSIKGLSKSIVNQIMAEI